MKLSPYNIGSVYLLGNKESGVIQQDIHDRVMGELRTKFKPEFLNRLDDIILFKPLDTKEIKSIVDISYGLLSLMNDSKRVKSISGWNWIIKDVLNSN